MMIKKRKIGLVLLAFVFVFMAFSACTEGGSPAEGRFLPASMTPIATAHKSDMSMAIMADKPVTQVNQANLCVL